MAWLAVDKNGDEYIYRYRPSRRGSFWDDCIYYDDESFLTDIELPKGSIKKLIGRELTWEDEPVEIKEG